MISIDEVYIVKEQGKSKLCADVKGLEKEQTLWFAVKEDQESMLCKRGGESFVLSLLLIAMHRGQDLQYNGVLSKRFVHGVNEYLIPSMAAAREQYNRVSVRAREYGSSQHSSVGGVAMQFSNRGTFPKEVEVHRNDPLYPLTYLCAFYDEAEKIEENRGCMEKTASECGLNAVVLEHNLGQLYETKTKDVGSFMELSAALALSGGLGIYLYCSENALVSNALEKKEERNLDVIVSSFASTDTMRIYLFDEKEELPC